MTMKHLLFLSGTGLVSLHLVDAPVVDVEPGASLARHIPWPAATLAVAAAAALSYEQPPRMPLAQALRRARAAVAGIFAAARRARSFRSADNISRGAWYVPGRTRAVEGVLATVRGT